MSGVRKGSSSSKKGPMTNNKQEEKGKGLKTLFLCISCETAIQEKEQAIECHGCKEWSHKTCSSLTDAQYSVLETSEASIQWFCVGCCKSESPDPNKTRLEAKLDTILKMMETIDCRMAKLEDKHSAAEIEKLIEEKVDRKVEEMMEEQQEREKRKRNIIIVNLQESQTESVEERREEDISLAKRLISQVTNKKIADELENPVRLGKFTIGKNRKPRLLRLTVRSEEGKREIMKNARKINEGITKNEDKKYINHDNTPKERDMFRKLREEMKERTEKGEEDLSIRGGRIVKRSKKPGPDGTIPQAKQKDNQ